MICAVKTSARFVVGDVDPGGRRDKGVADALNVACYS